MKVKVLVITPSKQAVMYEDDFEYDRKESAEYNYFEGNYGCDCNRALLCDQDSQCNTDENKYKLLLFDEEGNLLEQDLW